MVETKFIHQNIKVQRPRPLRLTRFWLPVLLVSLVLTLASSSANAHGIGYYLIRGVAIGNYRVHVWNAPGVLRTGDVHIDTAVMDVTGKPALSTLVQVTFVPLEGDAPPLSVMSSPPEVEYPHSRGATFHLDNAGDYRIELALMDATGMAGMTSIDVNVQTVNWSVKVAILALGALSASAGVWLLVQTKAFWVMRPLHRKATPRHLRIRAGVLRDGLDHTRLSDAY